MSYPAVQLVQTVGDLSRNGASMEPDVSYVLLVGFDLKSEEFNPHRLHDNQTIRLW